MSELSLRRSAGPRRSANPPSSAVGLGAAGLTLSGPSNQSALQQFQPPKLRLSFSQMRAVLRESEQPLRRWLDQNIDYVRGRDAYAG